MEMQREVVYAMEDASREREEIKTVVVSLRIFWELNKDTYQEQQQRAGWSKHIKTMLPNTYQREGKGWVCLTLGIWFLKHVKAEVSGIYSISRRAEAPQYLTMLESSVWCFPSPGSLWRQAPCLQKYFADLVQCHHLVWQPINQVSNSGSISPLGCRCLDRMGFAARVLRKAQCRWPALSTPSKDLQAEVSLRILLDLGWR